MGDEVCLAPFYGHTPCGSCFTCLDNNQIEVGDMDFCSNILYGNEACGCCPECLVAKSQGAEIWLQMQERVYNRALPKTAPPVPGPGRSTYVPANTIVEDPEPTDQITQVLEERGGRYGKFITNARLMQEMKRLMGIAPSWHDMSDDKKEALHMIVHKIARIVNGDPCYKDSWTDIIGYAKLVEETLDDE